MNIFGDSRSVCVHLPVSECVWACAPAAWAVMRLEGQIAAMSSWSSSLLVKQCSYKETWRYHSRFLSVFSDLKDYLSCWSQTVHTVFLWQYFCGGCYLCGSGQAEDRCWFGCRQNNDEADNVSRPAQLWIMKPAMPFHSIPNQSDINRNCALACRMHLIATLLSAVATTIVLAWLEENSYKERYFLFSSSQAKAVHFKCWPHASISLHDMQLLCCYCLLLKISDNLISMYATPQYMGNSFSQGYREQLEKTFTKAYVCKQIKLGLENY